MLLWEKEVVQPSFQLQGRNVQSVGWRSNGAGPNSRENDVPENQVNWQAIQFSSVKHLEQFHANILFSS